MEICQPFHRAWIGALVDTLNVGKQVAPRGMPVLERLAVPVTFDASHSLLLHEERGLNYRFAVAEWIWMAAGMSELAPLTRYNSQMSKFSDDGITLSGAYGPRLGEQWWRVLETLRRDPDSRQAVAVIWNRREETVERTPPSKDVPCTLSAQFLIRLGELESIWTMRSSDLWLGLPYDAYTFSRLHACVAGALNVGPGHVTIVAGSSHLYEQHWAAARRVIDNAKWASSIESPEFPMFPPTRLYDQLQSGLDLGPLPDPWDRYRRVLSSRYSDDARDILLEPWNS